MGIKLGSYVPPVHKVVRIGNKPHKTKEERIEEYKAMDKAMRAYTGVGIGITIDRRI